MRFLLRNRKLTYIIIRNKSQISTTRILLKNNLPAVAYKPEVVEKNKYDKWEKNDLFRAENNDERTRFSMVLPPPNVTGKLHLGHALACTIQDVIMRRKRSMGHNVLWLPGTDHAGIATQGVVEKYLKTKQNTTRHEMGRENFVNEVWKWKDKHGDTITKQLRTLGCSLDWSREMFTMDRTHTNAVNTAFVELFAKGLIYRKKALVNWCNALKSTVSDIEVDNISLNGPSDIVLPGYDKPVKFGLLYDFAYKIQGSDEEIVVSTTMPETMLGDMAIAVHPDDTRYQHLKGKKAVHPFRSKNQKIPIIFDEFVDMKFGTGAVKITPAHSKIDYDVAKHHHLPLLQVINEDGVIINTEIFNNVKRYDCRQMLVQKLDDMGLLKAVKPYNMTLPICSRSGDLIEHLPKEQWFLSCTKLNEKAAELVMDGELKIFPNKFIKQWLHWTQDDRDWCISRQLWWGHQIPAYKCTVDKDMIWIAAMDEALARDEASKILRTLPELIKVERDTDVLDTWFSSGIYPFASLGWPDCTNKDYKDFYPLNLMATGHDILGFWVHRMVILGLELTGRLPFNNVLLHGIICDSKGAKMSKSRGNVIDPIDVINGISMEDLKKKSEDMYKDGILNKEELKKAIAYHKANFSATKGIPECGVDALRFTLLTQDVKSHFVNFDVAVCHANKLFCNKIWQSIKYMQLSYDKLKPCDEISEKDLTYFDRWMLSRLADMVETVNTCMDSYDFHLATKAIRTLVYNEFCDVYLEATKPGFDNTDPKIGYAHAHTLSAVLNTALRCLAPYMIFITEELIPKIPNFESNVIINYNDEANKYFDFPKTNDFATWKDAELESRVDKVLDTISLVRELKGLYNITNKMRPSLRVRTTDQAFKNDLETNRNIILNLTRCGDLDFTEANKDYVKGLLDKNTEINVEIVGDDIENAILSAKNKLEKKIKKLEDVLSNLESRFSTQHYLTSVPEWVQVSDKEKLLTKRKELEELQRLI